MKKVRHRRASSFQCAKRHPAERDAQIAPIFAITNYPKNINSSHRVHREHRERNGYFHVLLAHPKGASQFRDNRLFLLCDLCVLCG